MIEDYYVDEDFQGHPKSMKEFIYMNEMVYANDFAYICQDRGEQGKHVYERIRFMLNRKRG